jgi:hypothetical protein
VVIDPGSPPPRRALWFESAGLRGDPTPARELGLSWLTRPRSSPVARRSNARSSATSFLTGRAGPGGTPVREQWRPHLLPKRLSCYPPEAPPPSDEGPAHAPPIPPDLHLSPWPPGTYRSLCGDRTNRPSSGRGSRRWSRLPPHWRDLLDLGPVERGSGSPSRHDSGRARGGRKLPTFS